VRHERVGESVVIHCPVCACRQLEYPSETIVQPDNTVEPEWFCRRCGWIGEVRLR